MNPDLFGRNFTLTLKADESALLRKEMAAGDWGGQQIFIYQMQQRVTPHNALEMTDAELHRAEHYAYDYGSGGWQAYSRVLVRAGQRAGWRSSRPVTEGR